MNDISGQCQQVCDTIVKFYSAIKASYPDIKIISSCDRSAISSHNPADLYDVHVYTSSGDMFSKSRMFDNTACIGPKAIVSEYAVTGNDARRGTLIAALAEAAFLILSIKTQWTFSSLGAATSPGERETAPPSPVLAKLPSSTGVGRRSSLVLAEPPPSTDIGRRSSPVLAEPPPNTGAIVACAARTRLSPVLARSRAATDVAASNTPFARIASSFGGPSIQICRTSCDTRPTVWVAASICTMSLLRSIHLRHHFDLYTVAAPYTLTS
uniref:Uncharacterized protein n=1 Tax=Zea mays TaxID=4577 RepID=A0A804MVX7_MAIZE